MLDLLIVPLNPNGLRMFSYPIETLRSAAMQNYIAEWASPNFHHAEYWPFLLVVLGTFAALSWSRLELRPRDLLLLLVSLYAAPLFNPHDAVVRFDRGPADLHAARELAAERLQAAASARLTPRTLLNGVIVLAMAVFAGVHVAQVIQRQPQAEMQSTSPPAQSHFFRAHPPAGRIFNHYDWGGYLIWKLYPSTPVFIDGRADLYGEQLFDQFADTYQFKGAWQQPLQRWSIDTVLVPTRFCRWRPVCGVLRAGLSPTKTRRPLSSLRFLLPSAPTARSSQSGHRQAESVNRTVGTQAARTVTIGMQEITPLKAFCRLL